VTTDIAIPQNWEEQLANQAASAAASVRPVTSTISLRAGIVSYQGVQAPNNKLELLVIAFAHENTLYLKPYDADNPSSPDCYAVGEALPDTSADDLIPAANVPEPQAAKCGDCEYAKWGSDLKGGRGKACQQRYRLVCIPASAMESADAVLGAEMATVKLPVTSGKIWAQYVQTVASLYKRPTWAVTTMLGAKPDVKTQFKAVFEVSKVVDFAAKPELYAALLQKRELALPVLLNGYDMSGESEREEAAAPTKATGRKK
jgi:hypothetical protein